MDYTEEVETVLPDNYSIGGRTEETGPGSSSGTKKKGGFFKKFSRREKSKVTSPPVTKSTTPLKKKSSASSSASNASQQKKLQITSASKIVKQERRDTEKAPTTSQPTRKGSPTPTTECSLTDESAESQSKNADDGDDDTITDTTSIYGRITGVQNPRKDVKEEEDEADTTSIYSKITGVRNPTKEVKEGNDESDTKEEDESDTTSIYGRITGVLSPRKSNVEEKKVDEAPSSLDSLLAATSAYVRGQSGLSGSSMKNMSSKKSEVSEPTKQHTDDKLASKLDEIAEQASVEVVQDQDGGSVVAKPEEVSSGGLSWANISLKVGGFEKAFQMADPAATVASITDKVNEVMGGLDSKLVKQAEEAFERTEVAVDYKENPTKLFLLLQQKSWGLAMKRLKKRPDEAEVWVYRKVAPENATASDPDQTQEETKPAKYRWKLLPLHAAIVLGAPLEVTTKILLTYPEAARKMDERGSLPVHLAASRLDVDDDGEKIVLQLFGVYADSIDIKDRNGRTAPELAKLARARKAAEKQRLMETATRVSSACIETSLSMNGREQEDDDDSSVKSSFSTRFRNMMKGSKSMDRSDEKKSIGGDLETSKSVGDDDSIEADVEGMAPGFSFLTAAKKTDEREAQTIADEVSKAESDEEKKSINEGYNTSADGLNKLPVDALRLPLPASMSFGDESVRSAKSSKSVKSKSFNSSEPHKSDDDTVVTMTDGASVVSTAVESVAASANPKAALRTLLEKACENAGRPGMDVTKFLDVLEEEWVTDVEAIRRLDRDTLDSILPIMLSRELQRLVNHSNTVDGEYLKRNRGRRRNKPSKLAKKNTKKRSARTKPPARSIKDIESKYARSTLDPINEDKHESIYIDEGDDETAYSAAATDVEENTAVDTTADENETRKNQAALVIEARQQFSTRGALEDAIHERQATVSLAVGSGFDVDRQTLAQAALADDEVRKLLPLRLALPTVADLNEMIVVLKEHKEDALKVNDITKALKIQTEMDEIEKQIEEEENYLRRKSFSETNCVKCGTAFETKKKMIGILKKKEMVCDDCRVVPMPDV